MFIAGVDEAGRGPVIGPMVMVVAAIDEKEEFELRTIGVKDSKLLSPVQRRELAEIIRRICELEVRIITPEEIDEAVKHPSRNLNVLEAEVTGDLINKLAKRLGSNNIKEVVLDCPSVNPKAYLEEMGRHISVPVKLVAEHKADKNHLIVAAASIVAKVLRDEEINKLKKQYNVDFGTGYPSDEKTVRFVNEHYDKYDFFRRTWSTYKNAVLASSQKDLSSFLGSKDNKNDVNVNDDVNNKKRLLSGLAKEGFLLVPTVNNSEVLRLKSGEATITLYSNGRVLVQGRKKDFWQEKVDSLLSKKKL